MSRPGSSRSALPARLAPTTAGVVAAEVAAAAATEAAASLRLRLRLVDDERPAVHLVLVKFVDGLLRVFIRGHFDEREPARAARRHVTHDADAFDGAGLAEQIVQ